MLVNTIVAAGIIVMVSMFAGVTMLTQARTAMRAEIAGQRMGLIALSHQSKCHVGIGHGKCTAGDMLDTWTASGLQIAGKQHGKLAVTARCLASGWGMQYYTQHRNNPPIKLGSPLCTKN